MKCRKLAYWCFLYVAVFTLLYAGLWLLPIDSGTFQVIGMFSIPFVVLMAVAGAIGSIVTFICGREWPLLVMSSSFLGLFFIFYLGEITPKQQQAPYLMVTNAAVIILLMAVILLSFRWVYLSLKKQQPEKTSS